MQNKGLEALEKEDSISPIAAVLVLILTFVLFFAIAILIGMAISLASFIFEFQLSDQAITLIEALLQVTGELMFLLVPLAYMLYRKINIQSYIKLGEAKLKKLLLGIGLGLGLWVIGLFVNLALTYILGPSQAVEEANETVIAFAKQSTVSLALLALALFLAGICEEFAFRGFLQNALESRYSSSIAIIGASLAFGLFHFDPQATYIIIGFVNGLVLGYAYSRLKSYVAVASAHMMFNLTSLTLILILIHIGLV